MADTPSVNQPASGPYGEQTALQNLKKSLPPGAMGNPAPLPSPAPASGPGPAASPLPMGKPIAGGGGPGGLPSVLTGPTTRPAEPVTTPMQPMAPGQGATPPDMITVLYALASSPQVSPQTREWAQVTINKIVAPGTPYDTTAGK